MASSLNKVMLMGNITRDVEVKFTNSQQAVATIGIAVNRRWKTPDGEQREETTFVDCDAWGKTAELIGKFFSKGRPIMIEGRLKMDTWQDKESGQNRSKLKVVIEDFYFVDSKPGGGGPGGGGGEFDDAAPRQKSGGYGGGGGGGGSPARAAGYNPAGSKPAASSAGSMGEDDIPF